MTVSFEDRIRDESLFEKYLNKPIFKQSVIVSGIDGCGKSTYAEMFARRNPDVHMVSLPSVTNDAGKKLRAMIDGETKERVPKDELDDLFLRDIHAAYSYMKEHSLVTDHGVMFVRYIFDSFAYRGEFSKKSIEYYLNSFLELPWFPGGFIFLDMSPQLAHERLNEHDKERFTISRLEEIRDRYNSLLKFLVDFTGMQVLRYPPDPWPDKFAVYDDLLKATHTFIPPREAKFTSLVELTKPGKETIRRS